jgi:hypothetical protein
VGHGSSLPSLAVARAIGSHWVTAPPKIAPPAHRQQSISGHWRPMEDRPPVLPLCFVPVRPAGNRAWVPISRSPSLSIFLSPSLPISVSASHRSLCLSPSRSLLCFTLSRSLTLPLSLSHLDPALPGSRSLSFSASLSLSQPISFSQYLSPSVLLSLGEEKKRRRKNEKEEGRRREKKEEKEENNKKSKHLAVQVVVFFFFFFFFIYNLLIKLS